MRAQLVARFAGMGFVILAAGSLAAVDLPELTEDRVSGIIQKFAARSLRFPKPARSIPTNRPPASRPWTPAAPSPENGNCLRYRLQLRRQTQ